jgi:hypothetical protein
MLSCDQPIQFRSVSSLWTPDGEHKVDRSHPVDGGAVEDVEDREQLRAQAQSFEDGLPPDDAELEEIRKQLTEAPVEVVIANHAYGLFELAAMHLSAKPPSLEKARLAVDALGVMVEGLAERLGPVEPALKEALAQIRLAYVQISAVAAEDQQSA